MHRYRLALPLLAWFAFAALAAPAAAEKKYDPGVSDSEIKLGQTMPYSGCLYQCEPSRRCRHVLEYVAC